jgi:hypothetical protein
MDDLEITICSVGLDFVGLDTSIGKGCLAWVCEYNICSNLVDIPIFFHFGG